MQIAGSYHKVAEMVSYAMGIRQRKVRKQELKVESASRSGKKGARVLPCNRRSGNRLEVYPRNR